MQVQGFVECKRTPPCGIEVKVMDGIMLKLYAPIFLMIVRITRVAPYTTDEVEHIQIVDCSLRNP